LSVEIISEHVNPLLGRKDAKLIVHHEGSGTPDRLAIRKIASDHFKTQQDKVYVRSVRTRTGGSSAVCQVEVYGDSKLADKMVPAYIKNRNLPKEQRVSRKKGAEEEKAAPAAPKPATPKPAAPEKKPEPAKPAPAKESKPAPAKESKPAPAKESKPSPAETKTLAKPEAKPAAKPSAKPDAKPKA
jgi:ribosomal protein S24E